MLDLSKVPVVDSNVKICAYMSINQHRCIKLSDEASNSVLFFQESKFNKVFNMLKNVLENKEMYMEKFTSARGCQWFRPIDIDDSLNCYDYFMVDRIPIYVEMFKYICKYKVCLNRDSLLSQNIYVLETVNNKIKRRKKLDKRDGLTYINL